MWRKQPISLSLLIHYSYPGQVPPLNRYYIVYMHNVCLHILNTSDDIMNPFSICSLDEVTSSERYPKVDAHAFLAK